MIGEKRDIHDRTLPDGPGEVSDLYFRFTFEDKIGLLTLLVLMDRKRSAHRSSLQENFNRFSPARVAAAP